MMNLVEKYTSETVEATNEDGVVAIEYVLMAGVSCARWHHDCRVHWYLGRRCKTELDGVV